MAAGKHGGYRENEFRDRESDPEVSRWRKDFYKGKEDYNRYRVSEHDRERSRNLEFERGKERDARIRHDIKERGVVNSGYHSSSNTGSSSSGSRRRGFPVRMADREPGELSSESGSDGAIAYESLVKDVEVSGNENGVRSPSGKKRKFSPIVWDREEKELSTSKDRIVQTSAHPPLQNKSSHQSPIIAPDGSVQISPIRHNHLQNSPNIVPDGAVQISPVKHHVQNSEPSPVKPSVPSGSVWSAASESSAGLSLSPHEQHWSNDRELGQLEEEDFVPMRNISSSRWADEGNSPADEGEISDDKDMPKRRKRTTASETFATRFNPKTSSPVLGELTREGSEGARAKSSSSNDGGHHVSSVDEHGEDEVDNNDYMDIDEENDCKNVSDYQSDIDSGRKDDCCKTPDPPIPPQRNINMLQGCRSVDVFEWLNKIDEGTYGVVYRAKDKKTGDIVALKKVKMEKEREGFPLTSLREINILLSFHHSSIVDVKEVVVGSNLDSIFMVMQYMEHDLKGLMETMKQPFSQSEVKCLMLQLLEGVKYLHDNWVLHRDLKTSNILLNNQGELKICDFGLSRQYGSPLKPYTHLVVTLWYRAPELLLGAKQYSTAVDMWSLGCIMAELLAKEPLFPGKTEVDQIDKIFKTLGTPNETSWPGFSKLRGVKVNFVKHQSNILRKKFPATCFTGSPILSDAGYDLLIKLLAYDPEKRITAEDALNHEWFHEVPLPKSKDFMPTFPAQHAKDRRLRRIMKSPDPLEEQRRKELQNGELGTGGLFG
ncbi:cyclin-dependent kinase G-2-like [Macadamia integrifolia]|uniref:cyclin-dependent kinase G-2-like n=1 Tax=Macadamia integrifolia TaxID=60698 RepID=UPI001C4F0379|nr:cyclin-dependent kinase G-2-like [Macadamia integrifolia]XP_042501967.1 cyclin-dependent kinase G-2-like [Macadamia integrifolia]XP_042501968.1 cyclin-dependent kinase G-2-like [Macadamia integrifolia]XP_042501969.1 cyclin-dependent kinase G-2-like [Macadamia integrifolia]